MSEGKDLRIFKPQQHKEKIKNGLRRFLTGIGMAGILVSLLFVKTEVSAGTIYDSPYVSFAPDGMAWTTDLGNCQVEWYAGDGSQDIVTGVDRTVTDPAVGEHYYAIKRQGEIPVAKWKVVLPKVNCIHTAYPQGAYHGITFVRQICRKPHFSGWKPVCADCGKFIVSNYFYLSRDAAKSISVLPVRKGFDYYYLCPFNQNLEQGYGAAFHNCVAVSANRYQIQYNANAMDYGGYMAPSYHIYNDAVEYEGRKVTPQTNLSKNQFTRAGFQFAGWNTQPDGSGDSYADEERIQNLCEEDYFANPKEATIELYAMWKPVCNILEIDPGGGSYYGSKQIYRYEGKAGECYRIDEQKLKAPAGCLVYFETNGGSKMLPVFVKQKLAGWKKGQNFHGKMQNGGYIFPEQKWETPDRLTAVYKTIPIVLPMPYKENQSFGGWYYDQGLTQLAGRAGDVLSCNQNMTLYAQWVELVLTSKNNYSRNGSLGAVDLTWSQGGEEPKIYKAFQSTDGSHWRQIYDEKTVEEPGQEETVEKEFVYYNTTTISMPYTGLYYVEVYGAQGSSFGECVGGLGGGVSGRFWFEKGERVSLNIGKQSGTPGGGKAVLCGNGGGYSSLESDAGGLLVIAGGGGGAGRFQDGEPGGGTEQLVESGRNGASGEAGGGGGYRGGSSGDSEMHVHEEGVCNHVHEGSPAKKGGCYTIARKCGQPLAHYEDGTEHWYWGGSDEEYCPSCGSSVCSGHDTTYYRHICPIHGKVIRNTKEKSPKTCTKSGGYGLSCGKTEEYICGYTEDNLCIRSTPAYGGSNYAKATAGTMLSLQTGVRTGDGCVRFRLLDGGYVEKCELYGVTATDMAAPDCVDVDSVKIQQSTVRATGNADSGISVKYRITWDRPKDNGTTYYHQVESFRMDNQKKISTSNQTANTLVSGISFYRYVVNTDPETVVTKENGSGLAVESTTLLLPEGLYFLHLAVMDRAGNLGETIHIPLNGGGAHSGEIPVYTKPLQLQVREGVFASGEPDTYYVRSDGRTPLQLHYSAYTGAESKGRYQICYADLYSDSPAGEERIQNRVTIPVGADPGREYRYLTEQLSFAEQGEGYLVRGDYVEVKRQNQCRDVVMEYSVFAKRQAHGKKIHILPGAGVEYKGVFYSSDREADEQNGIWLIGDGEAPVISGLEPLEHLDVLDRRAGKLSLYLSVQDELSGVAECFLRIENTDNGIIREYYPDENGRLTLDISMDEELYGGDFEITAYARDNVGNEERRIYSTTEFSLEAEICSIRPNDGTYKRGEWAEIQITSWGYVERIEVEFAQAFTKEDPSLNKTFVYTDMPEYCQQEWFEFMIPLQLAENGNYQVVVRAYKGKRMLEKYPEIAVFDVEGSILTDIRTRLR